MSDVEKAVARYGMFGEPVAEPDVLGEVPAHRQARLAGPMVEHFQPAGTRNEVDPIVAEVGPLGAAAVVEPERGRRDADRLLDHVPREQDPAVGPLRQARVEKPLTHRRTPDLHPVGGQHALRLVDDSVDQGRLEDVEARSHRRSMMPEAVRPMRPRSAR